MIELFLLLRRALAIVRLAPPLVIESPKWSLEDRVALHDFLATDTGIRLGAVLRDSLARSAASAVSVASDRLPWACGRAAGMQDAVALLDSCALVTPEDPAPRDDRPSDSLDWLITRP